MLRLRRLCLHLRCPWRKRRNNPGGACGPPTAPFFIDILKVTAGGGRKSRHAPRLYPALESLNQAAAGLLVRHAAQCVEVRGRFSAVFSGGATPRRTYELLAKPPLRDQVTWSRIHVFWGNERSVWAADF